MSTPDFKDVWIAAFIVVAALGAVIFILAIILETFVL